jgi:hypothetical protein
MAIIYQQITIYLWNFLKLIRLNLLFFVGVRFEYGYKGEYQRSYFDSGVTNGAIKSYGCYKADGQQMA